MFTLAIEAATKTVGLALLDEEDVLAELYLNLTRHHAEILLPALDQLLDISRVQLENIGLIACTTGPGSFTGLRIGVSTVKGLAMALDKPVVGVSTLEAIALNANPSTKLICALLDARRDQIYGGLYRLGQDSFPKSVRSDALTDITTFLQEVNREEALFLGEGAIRHENLIREAMHGRATLGGVSQCRPRASAVGLIGLHRYRTEGALEVLTLAPRYLRRSEAEIRAGS
jgi:tRNA threonylcarbamoyladenosine biosynthesis protein TsaB